MLIFVNFFWGGIIKKGCKFVNSKVLNKKGSNCSISFVINPPVLFCCPVRMLLLSIFGGFSLPI